MQCLQRGAPGMRGLRSSPAKGLRRARASVAVKAAIRARWCLDIKCERGLRMWGRAVPAAAPLCAEGGGAHSPNPPCTLLAICRYGDKLDAVALVQEWVQDIGSQAGLSPDAVRINSGSVGVPESRLEVGGLRSCSLGRVVLFSGARWSETCLAAS